MFLNYCITIIPPTRLAFTKIEDKQWRSAKNKSSSLFIAENINDTTAINQSYALIAIKAKARMSQYYNRSQLKTMGNSCHG